jgi:2-isopropylmalate synthase
MPHVFASQVEYVSKHLKYRDNVVLSLHPHNDRGCGVATAELGVLAGADRIEGTLFGNGERTGNMDIVTMAMNMYSHGVDPKLDFSDMQSIADTYERLTSMKVSMRQPYAGELVFTAFSGSHQDAISKGMAYREEQKSPYWTVPYLPIDPKDVGRTYDSDVIRINSQSGRGGVSYVLKNSFGLILPDKMKEEVGYLMKNVSDQRHAELSPEDIRQVFRETYMEVEKKFDIPECHFKQENGIVATVTIAEGEKTTVVESKGNGRLNAVNHAIKEYFHLDYALDEYEEHSLSKRSNAQAVSYVGITPDGEKHMYWGVGTDEDIIKSSIEALVNAVNRMVK